MPSHLLELRKLYAANLLEQVTSHLLEEVDDIILVNETHLAVNLSKLRLTVSTKVLITEALGNLEVTVKASHHQELLQGLRTLRKSIELSWVHTRRNDEIACAFWSTTNQDRCLHLHEVIVVEEISDQNGHAVTQLKVLAYARTAQVEITILHTNIVATIGVVLYSERRSQALRKHIEFLGENLNVASVHLRILALALAYHTLNLDTKFTTQLVGCVAQFLVVCLIEDNLGDTITVTYIDEGHTTHLT